MQSDGNHVPTPRNQLRRQPKQSRPNNGTTKHHAEVLSDSNVGTPNARRTPKQGHQNDRSASAVQANQRQTSTAQHGSRPSSSTAANGSLATPAKASYAGAAFHASPAPSSLPVPKFFSKSVPSGDQPSVLQARIERDGDKSDSNEGSTDHLAPQSALRSAKSPLDMFFNADRQEKAQRQTGDQQRPFLPDSRSATPSRPKEMFLLELDDTSSPAANRTETPPSLRRQRTAPENIHTQSPEEQRRAEQTQSLKSFLNITAKADTSSPSRSPFTPNQPQQSPHQAHLTTPAQPNGQGFHYGNRNLSPLFHAAARSPQPQQSPQHPFNNASPTPQNMHHYASLYNQPYAASPSKSPVPIHNQAHRGPALSFPQNLGHVAQSHQSQFTQPYQHGQPQQQPQHVQQLPMQSGAAGDDGDIRSMEEQMKKMLKMG